MDLDNFVPLAEYAEMIGRNRVTVGDKCRRGFLPGAVKIGRDWFIPKDAPYIDCRIKGGSYIGFRKKLKKNDIPGADRNGNMEVQLDRQSDRQS